MATEKEQGVGRCGFAAAPSPSGSSPVPGLAAPHSVTNAQREPLAPLLADLREPPVFGRFYMVPTVTYRLRGLISDWPVIGPIHTDHDHINFPHLHFHLDGRFLNARERKAIRDVWWGPEVAVNAAVVVQPIRFDKQTDESYARDLAAYGGEIARRPTLRKRRCVSSTYRWAADDLAKWRPALQADYGEPAKAICKRDGRKLCPHRKVDLSQFPADADGIVTCPLHGLRVRVSEGRAHA